MLTIKSCLVLDSAEYQSRNHRGKGGHTKGPLFASSLTAYITRAQERNPSPFCEGKTNATPSVFSCLVFRPCNGK